MYICCFINLGNNVFYLKNSFEISFFYKYIIYIFGGNDIYFRLFKDTFIPKVKMNFKIKVSQKFDLYIKNVYCNGYN